MDVHGWGPHRKRRTARTASLVAAPLLVTLIIAWLGAGIGVGQDAYPVAGVTASPDAVCPGGSFTVSGTGAPPGYEVRVMLWYYEPGQITGSAPADAGASGDATAAACYATPDAQIPDAAITTSDAQGRWSLTRTMPLVARSKEYATVPVPTGRWTVMTNVNENGVPSSSADEASTSLDVLDCAEGELPSTGLPAAPTLLVGAGLLISSIILLRQRTREGEYNG